MRIRRLRLASGFLALTTAIAAFWAGSALAASAPTRPAQSASGKFVSGAFHVQFSAHRAAGTAEVAATGTFTSTTTAAGSAVMSVGGPITCLSVVGNRVGLFYPVTRSSPTAISQLKSGVFVYLQQATGGQPAKVSFLPVPVNHAASCDPAAALLRIDSGGFTASSNAGGSGTSSPGARPKAHHRRRRAVKHHRHPAPPEREDAARR